MSHSGVKKEGIELPFIAELVMGIIAAYASYFYFRSQFILLAILIFIATVFLKRNAWAVSAAILMTLAFDLHQRQRADELRVVLILLAAGILLQLIAAFWQRYQLGYWGSSFTENAVFAAIGLFIGYGIQFQLCRPQVSELGVNGLLYLWQALVGCTVAIAMEPIATITPSETGFPQEIVPKPGMEEITPLFLATLGLVCLRTFLLTPGFWAMLMAGFRASGMAIWNPGRVLRFTWYAFWGMQLVGILVSIILAALGFTYLFLLFEENNSFNTLLDMMALIVILFGLIVGPAWGANRDG